MKGRACFLLEQVRPTCPHEANFVLHLFRDGTHTGISLAVWFRPFPSSLPLVFFFRFYSTQTPSFNQESNRAYITRTTETVVSICALSVTSHVSFSCRHSPLPSAFAEEGDDVRLLPQRKKGCRFPFRFSPLPAPLFPLFYLKRGEACVGCLARLLSFFSFFVIHPFSLHLFCFRLHVHRQENRYQDR